MTAPIAPTTGRKRHMADAPRFAPGRVTCTACFDFKNLLGFRVGASLLDVSPQILIEGA